MVDKDYSVVINYSAYSASRGMKFKDKMSDVIKCLYILVIRWF